MLPDCRSNHGYCKPLKLQPHSIVGPHRAWMTWYMPRYRYLIQEGQGRVHLTTDRVTLLAFGPNRKDLGELAWRRFL